MKQTRNFFLLAFCLIVAVSCCKPKGEQNTHRLIINSDGDRPKTCSTVADINAYVDAYSNTQASTFMICSGSDYFNYRSKYGGIFGNEQNFLNWEKEGTDMIGACLQRAKDNGMEAFISYRMNDLHFADTTLKNPVNATSTFWREHPEYWVNEKVGWHSRGAFDFAHKEVRERKLNIIIEQLEKYELLDGYDLDFMRFIVYFKSAEGEKNAPLMTGLVKDVKAKLDELSKKRGKKILLSARVPTDLDFCMKKGLDVKEWIRLGLLDFVTISIHYTGNPALPVAKFIKDLDEPSIPVYAGIEQGGYSPIETYSHGMFRGMASHNLAQGSDGNYLFNYFLHEYISKYNKQLHLEDGGYSCRVIMPELLHELGSLETLRKRNKIYCMDNGTSAFYGFNPKTPLPLELSPDNNSLVTLFIGDDPKKDIPEEVVLFIRTDNPTQLKIKVNGEPVEVQKPEYVKLYNRGTNLNDEQKVYAWILPASCLMQGDNEINFLSLASDIVIVKRLEIALKYGDVKTNGYF